ncbi:MAG: CapA family protein [bacterium]|nr:CapA family protein [bacterium]
MRAFRPPVPHATILFAGDMMFDRSVRLAIEKNGGAHIFSCIDPLLKKQDLVVANLEGPITENRSVSATSTVGDPNNFTFTFAPEIAPLLHEHNIRMVNLGNNHISNFGVDGVRSTLAALDGSHVGYFGDPIDFSVAEHEIRGIHFAFINYNEFSVEGRFASGGGAITHIREARAKGEIPVVYTHWGDEYVAAKDSDKELARQFIDSGAEIVIGSHPHVVQGHEVYKGKHIYYSLGNFIFDQYWDDDVSHGLALEVRFKATGVESVREIPVELLRDRRTCPLQ